MTHATGHAGPDSGVEIVELRPELLESFNACLDAVAKERRYLSVLHAYALDVTARMVKSSLEHGGVHMVALSGDRVVGWSEVARDQREGFRHCGRMGVAVLPEYRKSGTGKRLLEAALSRARVNGIERVEANVFASNEAAVKLYEDMGLVKEGVRRRARFLDGKYEDQVLMAVFLWPEQEV